MKILHILNNLRPSGAEEMLRVAASEWISDGFDLHILSIAKDNGEFAEKLSDAGWHVHVTGAHHGIIDLWNRIQSCVKDLQPDVIHIHPEAYGLLPCLVGLVNRIAVVRTVHSSFQFKGLLRIRKTVERWIGRVAGIRYLAISKSVLSNERERFGNPCVLCWNWIDTERYRPTSPEERTTARKALGLPEDRFIVVSVGNGCDVKNYRILIEAISILNMPDLLYCQVGNKHPHGVDEAVVAGFALADQVHFCGPRSDVLTWLWAADLFVMSSKYEGFGLAAVEAMAAGTPCIFTAVPGLIDFKEFDVSAKWVAPRATELAEAITDLRRTPSATDHLAISSTRVRLEFGTEAGAARYAAQWRPS